MVQRAKDACFLLRALQAIGVGQKGFRENFDGDASIEARVAGSINRPFRQLRAVIQFRTVRIWYQR